LPLPLPLPIAIGNYAGLQYQISNSIILNASGLSVNAVSQGFYVAPIASYSLSSSSAFSLLAHGTDNQVIQTGLTYSSPSSIISNSISDLILQSTPYQHHGLHYFLHIILVMHILVQHMDQVQCLLHGH
jgi:hypothetical protein